ncbi:MAG TPA: hypothetical protein DD377_06175 [Firmicutes bacterium]|nr:hypothetical protein [Bacillota bacterium]
MDILFIYPYNEHMKLNQDKQKEFENKLRENPLLLKKYKTMYVVLTIFSAASFLLGFILIIVSSTLFQDSPMFVFCFPLFFISLFVFMFSLIYKNVIKKVEQGKKENINKKETLPTNKTYEIESDNHRYVAPDFSSSNRFNKKEYTKNEDKTGSLETKVCPKCGFINKSDAKTCQLCGNKFDNK